MSKLEIEQKEMSPQTIDHICLELPLYDSIKVDDSKFLKKLRAGNFQLDAFCIHCGKETTFKTSRSIGGGAKHPVSDDRIPQTGRFTAHLACQRKPFHSYIFEFSYDGENLTKYGQLPSLADISGKEIRKYEKLLPSGHFDELKRATGLASHGIGIGSFVYLRRIFERLVEDHRKTYERAHSPITDFDTLRMGEKVKALKKVLPAALVQNAGTYGILSKGIHELGEEECLRYFPIVRQAIILILEQDLAKKFQENEENKLAVEIAKISTALKNT